MNPTDVYIPAELMSSGIQSESSSVTHLIFNSCGRNWDPRDWTTRHKTMKALKQIFGAFRIFNLKQWLLWTWVSFVVKWCGRSWTGTKGQINIWSVLNEAPQLILGFKTLIVLPVWNWPRLLLENQMIFIAFLFLKKPITAEYDHRISLNGYYGFII